MLKTSLTVHIKKKFWWIEDNIFVPTLHIFPVVKSRCKARVVPALPHFYILPPILLNYRRNLKYYLLTLSTQLINLIIGIGGVLSPINKFNPARLMFAPDQDQEFRRHMFGIFHIQLFRFILWYSYNVPEIHELH